MFTWRLKKLVGDIAVQKTILLMSSFVDFLQLDFSDDIVKIIQAAINSDGGQPEIKKANSMVKSFFIRVSWPSVTFKSAWYPTTACWCWSPKGHQGPPHLALLGSFQE